MKTCCTDIEEHEATKLRITRKPQRSEDLRNIQISNDEELQSNKQRIDGIEIVAGGDP